jgi:signal transduction histidine kinase
VSVPIRAELRAGDDRLGLLLASLPATQTWERADQTLLDLYASEIGVAIRNAELFNQVQDQNRQLRQLSEVKDDFLRGVSHNLQTPLTSIRSNADALAAADSDPRLTIISDQAERLTRMVQQLLLVGRIESQPPRPTADVLAIGPRVQRAWDALAVADRPLRIKDGAPDWLAVADGDQLDQVLWALLDNAVKYGRGPVAVEIGADPATRVLWTLVSDEGRGFEQDDRSWLFGRFERGAAGRTSGNGSGLGLYVSRALMRGMGGDLVLDDPVEGCGATFRLTLPGEPASEG